MSTNQSSSSNLREIPTITVNTLKGGVGKTTTTYNLAYYFSLECNLRVLIVDLDPQRNLSQIFFERNDNEDLVEDILGSEINRDIPEDSTIEFATIGKAVNRGIVHTGQPGIFVRPIPHHLNPTLLLLPGSLTITDFEEELAGGELYSTMAGKHLPGLIPTIIQNTARRCGADLILIDTSPSIGCLNMLVVMSSKYFLVPCQADFFSVKALELIRDRILLTKVGIKGTWLDRILRFQDNTATTPFPLPRHLPIFLGVIIQMFTVRKNKMVKAFEQQKKKLQLEITESLAPKLKERNMALDSTLYPHKDHILCEIRNFNRFAPMAQSAGLPLIALLTNTHHMVDDDKPLTGNRLSEAIEDVESLVKPIRKGGNLILSLIGMAGA